MLTVQPLKLQQNLSFKSNSTNPQKQATDEFNYSKDQYESDKASLQEHLDELNTVLEDKDTPKFVKSFGKLVSVGIGAALGFVSMKYGAQGVVKLAKKGASKAGDVLHKPFMKKLGEKALNIGKSVIGFVKKIYNKVADTKLGQKVGKFAKNVGEKIKNSKLGKKVLTFVKKVVDKFKSSKLGTKLAEKFTSAQETVKKAASNVTGDKVETGVVNLFAVSGGVSAGVSALQEKD